MTDTKSDVSERVPKTRRSGLAPWLLFLVVLVVVAAGVAGAVLLWPDADESDVLSETMPWGLTEIEMPKTEEEVIAVFEGMPEIDGRQPVFDEEIGAVFYEGTESEPPPMYRSIWAYPEPADAQVVDMVADFVAGAEQSDTVTVEARSFDPSDDLVWAVMNDTSTSDGLPMFGIVWAEPDGSWMFEAYGDSADFRTELVHAFITTVGS